MFGDITFVTDYDDEEDGLDATEVQDAVDAWVAAGIANGGQMGILYFPAGETIDIGGATIAPVVTEDLSGGLILGNGVTLEGDSTAVGFQIATVDSSTDQWLRLRIQDIKLVNCTAHFYSASQNDESLFQLQVENFSVRSSEAGTLSHHFHVEGPYESSFNGIFLSGHDSYTAVSGAREEGQETGAESCFPSSNRWRNVVTRNFENGFYREDAGDISIVDSTFLFSHDRGAVINSTGFNLDGIHVESTNRTSGTAGITVAGGGTLTNIHAGSSAANGGQMQYAVNAYASAGATVVVNRVRLDTDVSSPSAVFTTGQSGGTVVLIGVQSVANQSTFEAAGGTVRNLNNSLDTSSPLQFTNETELLDLRYTINTHGGSAVGSTETVDATTGMVHTLLLDENLTLTLDGWNSGEQMTREVRFIQDGAGTNTVTLDTGGGETFYDARTGTVITSIPVNLAADAETVVYFSSTDGGTTYTVFTAQPARWMTWSFDPKAVCDGAVDRLFLFTVDASAFPFGATILEWKVSFEADPTTEADLDLKRADAFIGVANSAVMDVLDTTTGAASEATTANINSGAAVATGKVVYLEFGTAYTETTHQIIFEALVSQ